MSLLQCDEPQVKPGPCDAIAAVAEPRPRDLGGFSVRRVLPAPALGAIGPFVFLDQIGPARFPAGRGIDVRPHPHIGLATVTYLFEGEILHRDSLGSVQAITPGALNWMTAGCGIVHSERSTPELRKAEQRLFGMQAWVALPRDREEMAPSFVHHPADALPLLEAGGASIRVIAGSLFGARSPVETVGDLFYAEARLAPGAELALDAELEERGVHVAEGELEIAGSPFAPGTLVALAARRPVRLRSPRGARVMLLGGARLDGPRHLWWNFVSSRKERIEQAKQDWRAGRFPAVPGDPERIPLPDA
jgi:redox-sensitive bicupin YhaK (pirin superfamily)